MGTGLTMAEKFRDEGRDVLLFIDNIYRYTLAGTEVSALLGRMPSAVGYQPTLAEEMGVLQERITWMAALGTALTLAGLVVSEIRQFGVRRKAEALQRQGQGSR